MIAPVRFLLRMAAMYLPASFWARLLARQTGRKPSANPVATDAPLRILALYHPGFRGDLEALADSGEAEVYLFPDAWQTRLVLAFYGPGYRNRDVMNPASGSRSERAKRALSAFYARIAGAYFELRPCDCVISFHIRIPADVDFGRAVKALNIPYCTIYREGLIASSARVERHMRLFFERLGGFQGDHFLVHNVSARDFCVTEGYSHAQQTWALGCMRMDGFLRDVAAGAYADSTRHGTATLFPVSQHFATREDKETFLREFYGALVGFFADHPEYRLIIKPKPKQLDNERAQLEAALAGTGLDWRQLDNVQFNAELDAHEALRNSDVVIGLNSTVMLEAGVAGKPVVTPMFAVLEHDGAREAVRFTDTHPYFDVARDGAALRELLETRMENPVVDDAAMTGRRAMFEKYVTALDGNALGRHIDFLRALVNERKASIKAAA
jgi:hypothetical protein